MAFFSWPTFLPLLSRRSTLTSRLPRRATFAIFFALAILLVQFNTVVHPFLLADNRHYTFYVIRLLILRHWIFKFVAIPIYLLCGWLTIAALGGTTKPRRGSVVAVSRGRAQPDTVHVSFVLVWLISTALSLVTAPLVEPRYFIVPWLVWRLHLPEVFPSQPQMETVDSFADPCDKSNGISKVLKTSTSLQARLQHSLTRLAQYSPYLEFVWYTTINVATCWLFLYRPFAWKQEPGQEQRFMW